MTYCKRERSLKTTRSVDRHQRRTIVQGIYLAITVAIKDNGDSYENIHCSKLAFGLLMSSSKNLLVYPAIESHSWCLLQFQYRTHLGRRRTGMTRR